MQTGSSQVPFNDSMYDISAAIATGRTSIVYKTTTGPVIKQYRPGKPQYQLERDVFWLDRLKGTGIAPELLDVDRSRRAVMMSDCGDPISTLNAPHDWETQLAILMDKLKASQCAHNDLSEHEVLVKDGKLAIVDFSFGNEINNDATFPDKIFPTGKFLVKPRFFLDDHIVNYIRFRLFGPLPGAEPHCFVLWKAAAHEEIQCEMSKKFEILRAIVYMPEIVAQVGSSREEFLNRFYSSRRCKHGDKGQSPFVLYCVLDKDPHYDSRTNPTRSSQETVNTNVFDLKHRLRGNRSAFLHGSDSIQECYDNFEALTIFAEEIPKSYWVRWRPKFAAVTDFFEHLNKVSGLEYLVLRNFDSLVANEVGDESDIDILVNDFYLFKRFSGAIGYKHKRRDRPGPAHEYGGYKVAGYVSIGGNEVSVDIRYVGSSYYDHNWERAMLQKRVRCKSFYIPDKENLFYSLIYHALVHKRKVRSRYRRIIGETAGDVLRSSNVPHTDEELWNCLDEFMQERKYKYVRPRELSIQLSAGGKERMGIDAQEELRAAITYANSGQPLEAIDLLQGILFDEPKNRQAKRTLAIAEKAARGSSILRTLVTLTRNTGLGTILPEVVKRSVRSRI